MFWSNVWLKICSKKTVVKVITFTWSKFDQSFYPNLPFGRHFSHSCDFGYIDLDSKYVLSGEFSSKPVKGSRKIGWVSISSKSIKVLWQSCWCRFTRPKNFVKENFDQVFDGKLWSCKRVFIRRKSWWPSGEPFKL